MNSRNDRRVDESGLSWTQVEAVIHEWIIGKNAERDQEIMCLWLLRGLTYEEIEERYMQTHPDKSISTATIKRIIKKRKNQVFRHFPG